MASRDDEEKHRRTFASNWRPLKPGHGIVPSSPVRHDRSYETDVKHHYVVGEFYDWVTDPRGFERLFHWSRTRVVRRIVGNRSHRPTMASLDVGCGTGLITRYLKGSMVIGVDINRWNLEKARLNVPNAHFVLCDVDHLPIRTNTIGLVICTEVIEHLYNPERAISEMRRVLDRDGGLVGSVPSRSPVWTFRGILSITHPKSEPFHHNYTRSELKRLVGRYFAETDVHLGNFMMNVFVEAFSPR